MTRRGTGRGVVRMTRAAFDLAVDQLDVATKALERWEREGFGAYVQAAKMSITNARKMLLCHHPDTEVVERELGATRGRKAS